MEIVCVPEGFIPPVVKEVDEGLGAFRCYDWYYSYIKSLISGMEKIFLVPCAKTKPIDSSPLHRTIYQKLSKKFEARGYTIFVVSEPVVLIDYKDLLRLKEAFLYDFPPRLLKREARELFVGRLRELLSGKDIVGCLPRHHASLVNDAIGGDWRNMWEKDMFFMIKNIEHLI